MKLGKKPFVPSPHDFKMSAVLQAQPELPPPPNRFGHGLIFKDWRMLGNDAVGDCVWAGLAHQAMLSNKLAHKTVVFSDKSVISDYSAGAGYDPHDPSTDQGTEVRVALSYARRTGVLDARGKRHKIGAYVSIDPHDWDELMLATYYFDSVGIGFEFPDSAMDQFDDGLPWDVVPGAQIEGGHYVPNVGRNSKSTGGVVSWARRVGMTRDFYETYNDESWAIISPESLRNGKNERGLDLAALNSLLATLA